MIIPTMKLPVKKEIRPNVATANPMTFIKYPLLDQLRITGTNMTLGYN